MKIDYKLIDPELRNLIKELNKCGLKTKFCCSGHNKLEASITFDNKIITNIVVDKICENFSIYWKFSKKCTEDCYNGKLYDIKIDRKLSKRIKTDKQYVYYKGVARPYYTITPHREA